MHHDFWGIFGEDNKLVHQLNNDGFRGFICSLFFSNIILSFGCFLMIPNNFHNYIIFFDKSSSYNYLCKKFILVKYIWQFLMCSNSLWQLIYEIQKIKLLFPLDHVSLLWLLNIPIHLSRTRQNTQFQETMYFGSCFKWWLWCCTLTFLGFNHFLRQQLSLQETCGY